MSSTSSLLLVLLLLVVAVVARTGSHCLDEEGQIVKCERRSRSRSSPAVPTLTAASTSTREPQWKKGSRAWLEKQGITVRQIPRTSDDDRREQIGISGSNTRSSRRSTEGRKDHDISDDRGKNAKGESSKSSDNWRKWLENKRSASRASKRAAIPPSTQQLGGDHETAPSNGEEWQGFSTKPEYAFRPPGQLGLSVIRHTSTPPYKSEKPVRVLKIAPASNFAAASRAMPVVNFASSLVNRAIPNAPHRLEAPYDRSSGPVRLMIFKLPSTGSTFFTELLQNTPHVWIAKELLTGADAAKSSQWLSAQMQNALTRPTRNHNLGVEPGIKAPHVIGFTVCPVVLPNADFKAAVDQLSAPRNQMRVAALVRSNSVKHAVGIYRAAQLRAKCHSNNVRAGSCALDSTRLDMSVPEFQQHLRTAVLHTHAMLGAAYSTCYPVYEVVYEDLQRSPESTLRGLFEFLGLPFTGPSMTGASTKKFTSDNLRDILMNYDAISTFLERRAPCLLPQLRATGPESFAHCGTLF